MDKRQAFRGYRQLVVAAGSTTGSLPSCSSIVVTQIKVGDKVKAGDVLLSIEAMKMETAIHAEADGVVAEVTVKPGDQIDSKDLLVRLE